MGALRILRKRMQAQFSKRDKRGAGRSPAPMFEFLEPRLLLSGDGVIPGPLEPFLVDLHPGLSEVTLRLNGGAGEEAVQVVDDGGVVQAQMSLSQISQITIRGVDGIDDTLRIDLDTRLPVPIQFEGGAGDSDTLRGPLNNGTWNITGPDSGEVEGIEFSGVENLTGAGGNDDTFVIAAGGRVSGLIEGGAGGYDQLKIADAGYSVITFKPTGPDSGSISLDGAVIEYAGFEPVYSSSASNIVFDLTALTDGDFTLDYDSSNTFKLVENSGAMESTTFTDPGAGNSVTINLGSGNDTIRLQNLLGGDDATTLNAEVIITGGAGDDTYVLDDKWGPNVRLKELATDAGTDTLDFGPFSDGGNTIAIAPQGTGEIIITGDDGSELTLDGTDSAFENLIDSSDPNNIPNIDLTGSLASVKTELVQGLDRIVTFARNLAASGNFLTDLPVIGKNADVTISKALDFSEALDEIRFQVEKFFDGPPALASLTTHDLIDFLNTKFQGVGETLAHLGAALLSAKSIANTLAGEQYDFKLTVDGVVYHVKAVEGATSTPSYDEPTKTVTVGFTAGSVDDLLAAINLAISSVNDLAGQVGVLARDGRLAFQVVSTEINEFKLAAGNAADAAATRLGLSTTDFVLSNVQDILKGLGSLKVSLASGVTLAVAFEGGVPKLRFEVNYRAQRTSDFFYDFGPQAQSLGLAFDVEAQIEAMAELVADFQLGLGLADATSVAFFLDVDALRAGIALTGSGAAGVDLNLGFLGLTTDTGSTVSLDAGLTVDTASLQDITDPSSISVGSLGLTPTGSDGTGSPSFDINLTLTVDAGTNDIGFVASGTLTAGGNPFDGSSITLNTDTSFQANFPDFNNLNSAGVISLLGQVAAWLDGLRGGDLISSIDIPFVEGGLDKILDLAEVLSNALLYDKGPDNVKDGADKLVTDLNTALATARLDRLIRAEGDGKNISFVAIDPEVTAFTVSKGPGDDDTPVSDGFEELGITSPTAAVLGDGVLKVVATLPGPLLGQLLGEAAVIRFSITRKGSSKDTDVTLLKTATTDNKGIGDDQPKLLDANNAPTFANAQELAYKLTEILASFLPGSVHYDPSAKVLTYDVSFTDVELFSLELPVDFELDLSPVGNIASNTRLIIDATGGINFTLGFDISPNPPASSGALTDATAFGDLNVPVTVKMEEAASADAVPRTIVGQLSGDANFTITYNPTVNVTMPQLIGQPGTDINVTQELGDQSETTIVVNPTDPQNMIIGVNDDNPDTGIFGSTRSRDAVWVTKDGGQHWDRIEIPLPTGATPEETAVASHGDPTVVFNRFGLAVYCHLVHLTGTLGADNKPGGVGNNEDGPHTLAVAVSTDGGLHWTPALVPTTGDSDKEFLAVGPVSSDVSLDRFVLVWHQRNVIFASTSLNGLSWTAPVIVGGITFGTAADDLNAAPAGASITSYPAFGPNGEIYVVWEDLRTPGVDRLTFDLSLDGGDHWGGGHDTKVFYASGESDLDDGDKVILDQAVAYLNSNPQLIVTVAGYTDTVDTQANNQTLSEARAHKVVKYLTDNGIDESRITEVAFNETQLAVQTGNGVAEEQNRRVELTFDQVIYTSNVNPFLDRCLITGASQPTQADPVTITSSQPHGLTTGARVLISDIVGMTELNGEQFTITVTGPTTFTLDGETGKAHTAYVSGGTWIQAGTITGATNGNPVEITTGFDHHLVTGDIITITEVEGMLELNHRDFRITVVDPTHFTLDNTNGKDFGTYTGDGIWRKTNHYSIASQPLRGTGTNPSIDVDRSGGAKNGRIYVSFVDQADFDGDNDRLNPTDHDNLDIFVIASDDRGTTWNALAASPRAVHADQVPVNVDSGTSTQFMPWLDIDQSTGNVAIAWLDTRNDDGTDPLNSNLTDGDLDGVANNDVEYFFAFSVDFGLTWTKNQQVSDQPSSALGNRFNYGEYNGLAFVNNVLHLSWGDTSNSTLDNPDLSRSLTDTYYDEIRLTNSSIADLVADLNMALADYATVPDGPDADSLPDPFPLNTKFKAVADGNVVEIVTVDPAITQFTLATTKTDPAFRDLGFQESAAGQPGGSLVVKAAKNAPAIVGQLTADASFSIDLDDGGGPQLVTVLRSDTVSDFAPNRNILDLVFDVQKAVDSALGTGMIKVSSDHGRLMFTRLGTPVAGPGDAFTITPGTNAAELGITTTLTSDEADLVITESDGVTQHRIVLDEVATIGQLILAISDQSTGAIAATLTEDDPTTPVNEADTGLTISEVMNPGVFSTTDSAGDATTLHDSGQDFLTNGQVQVGDAIFNLTDGSKATVVTLTDGSLTTTPLAGGTDNTWQSGDQYSLGKFKVDMANGSLPAVQLGIIGTDRNPQDSSDVPDGKIVGAAIAGAKLLDRFFITAPGANLEAVKDNLNHVVSAQLQVTAGVLISDIAISTVGGGKTTITASGFDFTKLGTGDISASGIKIDIKDIAGFAPGTYTVTDVIDKTTVKLDGTALGLETQVGGAGVLNTGVDASATFGFITIGLDGTADLGAEFSWGFNTASGAPAADGRLTAQEIIDGISDPLSLMLLPDLTPIPLTGATTAGDAGTTLTDSGQKFQADKRVQIGDVVRNVTDGSTATIASIDSDTQLTTTALTGGTENDWDTGDGYEIEIRNFGVVDASVNLDIGGDLSSLAGAIGAENPRITLKVLALGDPFIDTRFAQANYSGQSNTTFTLNGDFSSRLPSGATLRFGDDKVTVDSAVFAPGTPGTTTVTVTPSSENPTFTLPATLAGVDVVLLPKVEVDTSDLGDILPDFSNLSFADIIAMLRALATFLGQFESFGFLKEDIPVINKSVNDLLGFAEEFATKLDEFQSNPAGSLQLLEDKINESLGIAQSTLNDIYTDLSMGPAPSDVIDLSYDTSAGLLKFDLVWGTSFSEGLDVAIPQLDFGSALSALGLGSLLDLSGSANLLAQGSVLARLTLGMDVANFDISGLADNFSIGDLVTALGDHLFVFDTTGLDAHLTVGGEDIAFRVGVGPFALSIASTDTETAKIDLEGSAELGFKDTVFDPSDHRVSFSELFDNLSLSNIDAALTGTIEGFLPVFFPNDSTRLGTIRIGGTDASKTFTATGDLAKLVSNAIGGGPLNFELISTDADSGTAGVQGTKADAIAIDVSDIITGISGFDFSHFNIFDNIILAVDGLDLVLESVQDLVGGQNFSFPLIGGDLAQAAGFIRDLRNDFITPLREAIETAKDTAQDFADPNKNIISKFLFDILGPNGANLLLANEDGGTFSPTDPGYYIGLDTNLDDFLFDPQTTLQLKDVYIEWDLNLGSHIADQTFDIGFDLGIPGLGLKTEGDLTIVVDWALDLAFGLNFTDGFFIRTDDPDELLFNIDVQVPAAITGTLGFLGLRGEDKELDFDSDGGNLKHTALGATFKVDIFEKDAMGNPLPNNPLDPNEDGDRLGFTEFGSMGFEASVAAEASAALGLTLGLSNELFVDIFGPGAANVISGFPTITGDFRFLWQLGNRATNLGTSAQEIADNPATEFKTFASLGKEGFGAIKAGLKFVSIEDISLDLGSFMSEVLGPIVDKVSTFTEPVQPLIDFVTSPIPILGQLGLDVTWLDLAQLLAGDKVDVDLIQSVAEIITLINNIADLSGAGPVMLPIGDFVIYDPNPIGFAPNIWDQGLDLDQVFAEAQATSGVIGDVIGAAGGIENALSTLAGGLSGKEQKTANTLAGVVSHTDAGGFAFPFLEHPDQIFGLLMGKPADLVTYDLGKFTFEFDLHQFFSIFGPLGVSIGLMVQFMVDTAFGYDTQGIQDFVDSGFRNPELLFNGFYISDSPKLNGVDDPELTFLAELQAAAELNLGIARAGVAAAFGFQILFDLFDPNHDLKVRFDELLGNITNQLRAPDEAARLLAPLAIFDVSGEIYARLFAFLNIDFGFFSFEKEFPIFGPVTLLSYDVDFFRPPILASEQDNGDLIINTGQFANQRLLGNATDLSEHIIIHKTGTSGDFIDVEVYSGGMRDNLGDDSTTPLPFKVKKGGKIIIDGGQGDDYFQVTGFAVGDVLFEIDLGVGNDKLELTGGIEGKLSTIKGGAGDDIIGGSAGSDLILGGMGTDDIKAGDGSDLVFGDEGEIGTDSITALVRSTDGVDTIDGQGGSDILIGGGGKDHIEGGTGGQPDMLIGGGGVVFFKPGTAKIFQNVVGIQDGGVQDVENQLLDTSAGDVLIGDGGDIIYGTAGPDVITGTGANDIIFGMGGADTIDGAAGNDIIFGDNGQLDPGAGGSGVATGGNATALTDSGAHFVTNGVKVGDYVRNEVEGTFVRVTGVTSDTTVETETVGNWSGAAYSFFVPKPVAGTGDAPDVIQGGAGNDLIFGGGGGDFIAGGIIFGLGDPDPGNLANDNDQIYGGSGPDVLVGDNVQVDAKGKIALDMNAKEILSGDGADRIFGEGEPDKLFGGGGFDLLDGGAGPDVLKGGAGADTLLFNKGSDRLDGEQGGDSYFANFQGGDAVSLVIAQDTGTTGADLLAVNGTVFDDQFLLRANTAGTDAFIALIKNDFFVERINYGGTLERILVNGGFGDDHFAIDDTAAEITINGDFGDDTFQVGQIFRSQRTPAAANVSVTPFDDTFATIETTRGFLSNGISEPMTINGGLGNDRFVVFHNKAVLQLNGEGGDDTFEIRAFALAGSQEPQRERTDISGGAGADLVMYAVNAPVNIDGGDGFDTVVIIGTEFGDDFVVTEDGVFGAGLTVSFVDIESLRIDAAEGNDRIFVKSTSEKFITEIFGGLGADTVFMSGDTPPIVSNDLRGHSGIITHDVESSDLLYDGQNLFGISANVADNDEPFIVVRPTDGSTIITEGSTAYDEFQLVLTRDPFREILVLIAAPLPTPSSRERGAQMFRVDSPDVDPTDDDMDGVPDDVSLNGTSLILRFDSSDWFIPKTVRVLADDSTLTDTSVETFPIFTRPEIADATTGEPPRDFTMNDEAYEGVRFGVVNISVQASVVNEDSGMVHGVNATKDQITIDEPTHFSDAELIGQNLRITSGLGLGQNRFIRAVAHEAGKLVVTLDRPYGEEVPDSASVYLIQDDDAVVGKMDSFREDTAQLITDGIIPASTDPNDQRSIFVDNDGDFPTVGQGLTGATLEIVAGAGLGQQRLILGNSSDTLILNGPWRTDPDSTSIYRIERYDGMALPSVSVQVNDDDRPGLIVDETHGFKDDGDETDNPADVVDDFDTITALIEGGDGDYLGEKDVIQVRLSADPDGTPVQVGLIYDATQLEVRDLATGTLINNTDSLLTFSDLSVKSLEVTALKDGLREGFHTSLIQFEIHAGSADNTAQSATEQFRTFTDAAIFFVGLAQTPNPTSVQVFLNGSSVGLTRVDSPDENGLFVGGDFFVADNKVVFVNSAGDPLAIEGTIEVQYTYNKRGFLSAFTDPVLAKINDFEAPTVVVRETDGSTDVIEVNQSLFGPANPNQIPFLFDTTGSPWRDSYQLVLSASPRSFVFNGDTAIDIDQDTITFVGHALVAGGAVVYSAGGGTEIGGLTDGERYYVIVVDESTIKLAATAQDASDGSAIDLTAAGVGMDHSLGALVSVTVAPEITKTTRTGGIRHDAIQVEISSADGRAASSGDNLIVTFGPSDWDNPVVIAVKAKDDAVVDGGDTKVFTPGPATLSGILGPVVLQGAGGAGSLSLGVPVLLPPDETNLRTPDGAVYGFEPGTGFGAIESMTVHVNDLQARVDADDTEGDDLKTIDDLIGLTIEMARGQGLGVVLNPERPDEAFDRFWLIKSITTDSSNSDLRILELQNPSQVDPSTLGPADVPIPDPAPDPQAVAKKDLTQAYAITALSPNFFVEETTQVDVVFVHDEDNPADSSGVLTSTRLYGFNMGPDLVIGGELRSGGITYDDFEVLEINLGKGNNNLEVVGTQTREDGYQSWTLINTGDETVPFADVDNPAVLEEGDDVVIRANAEDEVFSGTVVSAQNPDLGLGILTTTITVDQAFAPGSLQGALISIGQDETGMPGVDTDATGQERRIINNIVDPLHPTRGILTVDRPWAALPTVEACSITNEADGPIAVNLQLGDDELDASDSDLGVVAFGGLGMDTLTGGSGDDILFGDRGRVDYFNVLGAIVTRLGYAPEPITGFVTAQVAEEPLGLGETDLSTIEDTGSKFSGGVPIGGSFPVPDTDGNEQIGTEDIGLRGLYVDINNGFGFLQTIKLIDHNDGTRLFLAEPFDTDPKIGLPGPVPGDPSEYRISTIPEDQTDGVIRDPTLLITVDNDLGDVDTIDGGAGNDTIFGGAGGDIISAGSGDDIVVGDAGRLDRARDPAAPAGLVTFLPRSPSAPEVKSFNDRLRTIEFAAGDDDAINGDAGDDILIGGTEDDTIDGGEDRDIVFGDQGQVMYVNGEISLVQDPGTTGDDTLSGGTDFDLIIGGLGDDTIDGNAGPDILIGDEADVDYAMDGVTILQIDTVDRTHGGVDTIYGGSEDDILIGGTNSDNLDGGLDQDLIFGDNVLLVRNDGSGDAIDPRFRALAGTLIYGPDGSAQVAQEFDASVQPVPGGRPAWADWTITLDQTLEASHFGNDYIAGGGGDDEIFGQRGDDTIQGDGSLASKLTPVDLSPAPSSSVLHRLQILSGRTVTASVSFDGMVAVDGILDTITLPAHGFNAGDTVVYRNDGSSDVGGLVNLGLYHVVLVDADTVKLVAAVDARRIVADTVNASADQLTGLLLVTPSFEYGTDGDDYIEGNAGSDVIFGNLGQDDVIGGSSTLFSLTNVALRDDGSDLLFGGAGTEIARNDPGTPTDGTPTADVHGRDADMILGDNGNIFRLVGINGLNGGAYLTFNYDNYGTIRIVPRAAQLLDYTPGGTDFDTAAVEDIGMADEIHGESGDDFIYGMVGPDVLFGDGQDDDLSGGYGNDWFSGGTGQDGVVGDDGRISTSRNGTAEALYGLAATTETTISTPGNIMQATINATGQLKKTVNLTPFSVDPNWNSTSTTDEFGGDPTNHGSDDIIYGGWGSDFLHGGSGDDAISGAEALPVFFYVPVNLGNALGYDPTTGEFADYDEYYPLAYIPDFLLNFDKTEGPEVALSGFATVHSDGNDMMFGDLGNDWLVGGTGNDHMYGGWGNDLLNADDDLDTAGGANTAPDSNPSYQDIAFGGAGLDVLIANTGGDRLIDWVGEYNSYIVPFSPFGLFTVLRLVQPQLPEFLYALSQADGADPTRSADNSGLNPDRNGEPYGELGLIRQQDPEWQDQTGAPRDPQPGNTSSQKRDILGKELFDTTLTNFAAAAGTWAVSEGKYVASAANESVSLYDADQMQPPYYEIVVTMNADKVKKGAASNGYIIFDYQSPTDFKFAGINITTGSLEIGHRTMQGWVIDAKTAAKLQTGQDTKVKVVLNGTAASFELDEGTSKVSYTFLDPLNDGMIGLAARNSSTSFDNWQIQQPPTATTFTISADFSGDTVNPFTAQFGSWQMANGVYAATAASGATAVSTIFVDVVANSRLDLQANIVASAAGVMSGLVFDYYGPTNYKFAAIVAGSNQVVLGHVTTSGVVIDASLSKTIAAGTSYLLGISLKGNKVSVSLSGTEVLDKTYYSLLTDGALGLQSKDGTSIFDNVVISGDDPAFGVQTLSASTSPEAMAAGVGTTLTVANLDAIVDAAIARMSKAYVLDAGQLATLESVNLQSADLGGLILGETSGTMVFIDTDAAGYGWFIDDSPLDDVEFNQQSTGDGLLVAGSDSEAFGNMDLLTAVMHELGHVLGFADLTSGMDGADLMFETLSAGTRRTDTRFLVETGSIPEISVWYSSGVSKGAHSLLDEWLRQHRRFV